MSAQPDGTYTCDRDGVNVGGGGLVDALVVSDLDPDNPGMVRNLHFCRDRTEDDTEIIGCASIILTEENLADYLTKRQQNGE